MLALLLVAGLAQDSLAAVRAARQAQERFEVVRRVNLPASTGSGRGRCDERIGRFCYWYDPDDPPHPPEPAVIGRARDRLLESLARAVAEAPGDPWVIGQEVRYLLEAGRLDAALAAARACRAGEAWCAALAGLVLHLAGEDPAADSAFSRALRALPADQTCAWGDLSLLLGDDDARRHRRLACDARLADAEHLLGLARPLLSRPGNSVRGDFFARQTMVRLLEGTTTPHGFRFGPDQRELVLRYGWPVAWSRARGPDPFREGGVTGHDHPPAWAFLPADFRVPRWELDPARARARFRPPGMIAFRDLPEAQIARFPRGDSLLIVAAWRAPADTLFDDPEIETSLAAHEGSDPEPRRVRQVGRREGVLTLWADASTTLAGVEVGARDGRAWARFRTAWPAGRDAGGLRLSDLLLFDPRTTVPDRLDEVLPLALRGARVRRGSPLGLYWEASRLPAGADSGEVRITIRRASGGRALQTWAWQGPLPAGPELVRSVALDLPRLGRGQYLVEVQFEVAGLVATVSRFVQID